MAGRRHSPVAEVGAVRRAAAFSLLEVVVAVGVFALGMVAVVGLYAPVAKSVTGVADAEAAGRVADAVRARLGSLPFETALALVQTKANLRRKDGDGAYNPNDGTKNPEVLFGKLSGDVGIYDAAREPKAWYDARGARVLDADKFFEIDLVRNETLSPVADDATAAFVAYTIRVRWPAFLPSTSPAGFVQVGANPSGGGAVPYDHSRKTALFFTGTIQR